MGVTSVKADSKHGTLKNGKRLLGALLNTALEVDIIKRPPNYAHLSYTDAKAVKKQGN
jgi:hypothetical protein